MSHAENRSPPRNPAHTSFDRAARTYLAHAGVQTAMAEWLSQWVPRERDGRALEIGAGPGIFTRRLLPWPGRLTASDLSEEMCTLGRIALPHIEWRTMSAEAPAGRNWDWIFSSSMLQWAQDPTALFRAWRSRLARGGRVLGGMFVAGSLAEWRALTGDPGPLVWRSAGEWAGFLESAGFRILRSESRERLFRYPSALEFMRSLHGIGAAPQRQYPPGRLRSLLRDYEARHRSRHGVGATWVFFRFEAALQEPPDNT